MHTKLSRYFKTKAWITTQCNKEANVSDNMDYIRKIEQNEKYTKIENDFEGRW